MALHDLTIMEILGYVLIVIVGICFGMYLPVRAWQLGKRRSYFEQTSKSQTKGK